MSTDGLDNATRELVVYYVDHAHRPAEALRIAEREPARQRDVYTLDAYAWALAASGRLGDARKAIESALAVSKPQPSQGPPHQRRS